MSIRAIKQARHHAIHELAEYIFESLSDWLPADEEHALLYYVYSQTTTPRESEAAWRVGEKVRQKILKDSVAMKLLDILNQLDMQLRDYDDERAARED